MKDITYKKLTRARRLFLIVRGPQSEFHKAPFHPIIVCSRKHTAKWESMRSKSGDTVFENLAPDSPSGNWLLVKYKGYDIDYGTLSHYFTLFDGKDSRDVSSQEEVSKLLSSSVWWSYDEMPEWFKDSGIKYVEDDFSKKAIWQDSGTCLLKHSEEVKYNNSRRLLSKPSWI